MTEETTLTVPSAERTRDRSVVVASPAEDEGPAPAEGLPWFTEAIPGRRPAFRGTQKIGMG